MLFKYIDEVFIFLDFGIYFADLLENMSFLKIFWIDIYIGFYDNIKDILRDFYF